MKTIKILFAALILALTITSCQKNNKLSPSTEQQTSSLNSTPEAQNNIQGFIYAGISKAYLTGFGTNNAGISVQFSYVGPYQTSQIKMYYSANGGAWSAGSLPVWANNSTKQANYKIPGFNTTYQFYFKEPGGGTSPIYTKTITDSATPVGGNTTNG